MWRAEVGTARPLVTVLLPVRDSEATLPSCLESVVRQTLADWECLVVDDGSEDGSRDVVRRFRNRDSRFRLVEGPARGLVAALGAGLSESRGTFTARMDGDDLMHRTRLDRQVAVLEGDHPLDAVGCHVRLFPRKGLGEGILEYERWINGIRTPRDVRAESFVECPLAHPGMTVRTEVLRKVGYRDRGWPEDYDLILRMLERGCGIGVVPSRLLAWRHGPGRLSRVDPRYGVDRFVACKAHFLRRGFLAGRERYTLWGYGHTGRAMRRALERLGRIPRRIVDLHPGRLAGGVAGAEVIPPDRVSRDADRPMLVSVAGSGPRGEIRRYLEVRGFRELRDFVCVA